jgi:hypothetical protein
LPKCNKKLPDFYTCFKLGSQNKNDVKFFFSFQIDLAAKFSQIFLYKIITILATNQKIDPKKKKKPMDPNLINFCTTNTVGGSWHNGSLSLSLSLSCCPAPLGNCKFQTLQKLNVGRWSMKILTICKQCSPLSLTHSLTHSFQLHRNNSTTTAPRSEYSSSQYVRPNGNFLLLSVVAAQFFLSLARAEPIKENLCGLFTRAMMLSPRVL